jgi:hypothetical protein
MSWTVDRTVKDIDKACGNSTGRCQGAELVQTGDGQWAAHNVVFGACDVHGHERAPAPDMLHQGVRALWRSWATSGGIATGAARTGRRPRTQAPPP